MRKQLAKISAASFGFGGYDGAMLGLSLTFSGDGMGCGFFEGTWSMPPSEHAQWTVADQDAHFAKAVRLVGETLKLAKKKDVAALVGTPVELTFDGMTLQGWRVLTEVL